MIYKKYFSQKIINQEIFNKKINWYYDIKSILYQKRNLFLTETVNHAKIIRKDFIKLNLKRNKNNNFKFKSKKTKKIIWKNYINSKDRIFKKKIYKIFIFLYKNKIQNYTKHFVVHGSIASNDYIKGWSDLDTFVVLKNEILFDVNKIISLRHILKIFYKKLISISKFQHHGLILFTELDLKNYLNGFLPIEALKKNFDIFQNSEILIRTAKRKRNLSLQSLKERYRYLKDAQKTGLYKHHSLKGINLEVPLKVGRSQMYQLFCHIGFVLNIPILYFDATNRSIHKKKSFKKFYKEIKDSEITELIKKSEKVRKLWQIKNNYKNDIPNWVIKILGENYMLESLFVIKKIIKKIKNHN